MRSAPPSSVVLATLAAAAPAWAGSIINVPGDQPTIQAGMAAAGPGDEVVLADGVYTGPGNAGLDFLGVEMVVRSASGDPTACIIDCENVNRGFQLISGEGPGAQIRGLTIRNAIIDVGAGVFAASTAPVIDNCIFESCSANNGGGIWANGGAVISNCRFEGCHAVLFGGGIYYQEGSATITGCVFADNTTDQAGAGLFVGFGATPMVSDCAFLGNAGGAGGGIETDTGAAGMYIDCTFTFNTPSGFAAQNGDPSIIRCLFAENSGNAGVLEGAGVRLVNSDAIVSASRFRRNAATSAGGGMAALGGSNPTVTGCSFVDNSAQSDGGGLFCDGGSVALERCTFIGNQATIGLGAALAIDGGTVSLSNCHVIDNDDNDSATGATILNAGTLNLTDTLVCGDTPTLIGGGFADNGGNRVQADCPCYRETFESYADASSVNGQGHWAAWDDNGAFGDALVSSSDAINGAQALSVEGPDDVVQAFSGLTSGRRTILTHQFVPASHTGTSMFIVLNTYEPNGPKNWSLQLEMDSGLGVVRSAPSNTGVSLITDQWVEIRVDIDLDADTQSIYYGGQLVETKSWSSGASGGGRADIDVIDLFGNGSTEVLYDEIVVCDVNVRNTTQQRWYGRIQPALDEAADGDDIDLLPGTFYERVSFPGGGPDYTVGGTPTAILDGEGLGTVVRFVNGGSPHGPATVLHDVIIRNGSAPAGGGVDLFSNHPTLERCTMIDNQATGGDGGGLRAFDDCSPTLISCLFQGNSATTRGGGMSHHGGGTATLIGCRFAANTANGAGGFFGDSTAVLDSCEFELNSSNGGGGAMALWTGFTTMTNCVVANNTAVFDTVINLFSAPTLEMTNCTIVNNDGFGLSAGDGTVTIVNSIIWGNANGSINGGGSIDVSFSDIQGGFAGSGNIDADPLLTNPAVLDVTLQEGSPAINAGTNVPGLPATDFEGGPRIQQCRVDMGASESPFFASDCDGDGIGDACAVGPEAYVLDDGIAEIASCWGSGTCADVQTWANQFDAGGGDIVGAVAVAFNDDGSLQVGDPVTVYLWEDPNDDGIPDDAVLISSAAGTVGTLNTAGDAEPETFDVIHLPPEAVVGSFFVGVTTTTGEFPIMNDLTDPTPGRSWGGPVPGEDGLPFEFSFPYGMVRAHRTADADGNGVPDSCQCPADTNSDGQVDVDDLVNVILAWGTSDPNADVDGNGFVDVDDLVQVILSWGPC